ncbi:MAG: AAA-like domain-containing protein [Woeseia sp.]
MAEISETDKSPDKDRVAEFFSVGQPLHPVRGGYVGRPADSELYDTIIKGSYAYVMAPAHTGKSSLIAATAARLRNNGYKIATLDLSQIAERDGDSDAGRWYYSIAYRLLRQLRIKIDLQDWWQDKSILSNRQRLVEFYVEVILQNIREQVVVFVDEVQVLENLEFKEHLLPSIRAAHNARTTDPELERLIFVLSGEGDPHSLTDEESLSPFAVAVPITLQDFSRPDLEIFATELNVSSADARAALDRVWHWTGGQPYLCQKLCRALAREPGDGDVEQHVDQIVQRLLAGRAAWHSEPHMHHIHRRIVRDKRDSEAMLTIYGRLRKGLVVLYDPDIRAQRKLLAIGLLKVSDDGELQVRNRLYEAVFTARWANRNLPLHWRGPAAAALLVAALLALPFWYTQLLPKPYVRALVSPTLALESVDTAWRNLRSFPGHAATADRLYRNQLDNRAIFAASRSEIETLAAYAGRLPDAEAFAPEMVAKYWDRQARVAARAEQRDSALLASLEALTVATPERRRFAAALLGRDYPQLLATLRAEAGERMLFSQRDMLVSIISGARVLQWALQNRELVAREPWTISALEVAPLVRRIAVDSRATATRLGLRVNVSHARLADLRMKLIAPSGRAVDLEFPAERSSANDEFSFDMAQLAELRGEPLAGTWSLSLRDEATGVSGHLVSWDLNLNSQGLVESFERGLDIPAPVERESNNIWFGPQGRYAVARAQQSDSARMWDLTSAQPARTVAVPADEEVVGVTPDARYLVTRAQDNVHLWRTVNGRRETVLQANVGGAEVSLTRDGQHLFVARRGQPQTVFELWSLEQRALVAQLRVGGSPAHYAIDSSGRHIAVADYDRAVRIWDMQTRQQLVQLDQHSQPSDMRLSPDGTAVAVLHGEQGMSLWRTDSPGEPILLERGGESWQLEFSPVGDLLIAGSARRGYRIYRTADGTMLGPALDAGMSPSGDLLLAFSLDEKVLVTAAANGPVRFWERSSAPQMSPADNPASGIGHRVWRSTGDSPAAVSPGGGHLAIGDNEGHVHILSTAMEDAEIAGARDELNFIGHQGAILDLVFSADGKLVASAGVDGTLRVWDVATGLPRPHSPDVIAGQLQQLRFSHDARWLAILTGQRVVLLDVASGGSVANVDLGELHTSMAFAADGQLLMGTERGVLRSLSQNRAGQWNLREIYSHNRPIRQLAAGNRLPQLVIVDADNRALLLKLEEGQVATLTLQLPAVVTDVLIAPGDSRVLFRTPGWVHRASLAPSGLRWLDTVRVPNAAARPALVLDRMPATDSTAATLDPLGSHLLLLTPTESFVNVTELSFGSDNAPPLFGTQDELLDEWSRKLGVARGQVRIGQD